MKLPGNLLKGMNGKKPGLTVLAVVLMACAAIGGAIWGIWAKFSEPATASINTCPAKAAPLAVPPATVDQDIKVERAPCDACGMG